MRRKTYTREFKIRVVQEAIETGNNTVVARRYDIHPSMVAKWVRQYKQRGPVAFQRTKKPPQIVAGPREVQELQRKNERLKKLLGEKELENAILKDLLEKGASH